MILSNYSLERLTIKAQSVLPFFLSTFGLFRYWAQILFLKTQDQVLVTISIRLVYDWYLLVFSWSWPGILSDWPRRVFHFLLLDFSCRRSQRTKSYQNWRRRHADHWQQDIIMFLAIQKRPSTLSVLSNALTVGLLTHFLHIVSRYNTTRNFLVEAGANVNKQSTTDKGWTMIPTKELTLFFCRRCYHYFIFYLPGK
jgi:hypothetical protein